jgi:hypothetical protein
MSDPTGYILAAEGNRIAHGFEDRTPRSCVFACDFAQSRGNQQPELDKEVRFDRDDFKQRYGVASPEVLTI